MTKLSVNINKIALIRNSRGANQPNLLKVAADCERFGAQGITIHPRPDERHARYQDVFDLKSLVTTELNVEGNPIPRFMEVVCEAKPHQVTLVPDSPQAITSDAGWDTLKHQVFLKEVIAELKSKGIRVSVFVDPMPKMVEGAKECGADRVELYTESYARNYLQDRNQAIAPYLEAALAARVNGLGLNAGHDLNLENLHFFFEHIPHLQEVSIGHALVCDALYMGLENAVQMYLRCLHTEA
jgi:pyridoxine 5-phosphate synthase